MCERLLTHIRQRARTPRWYTAYTRSSARTCVCREVRARNVHMRISQQYHGCALLSLPYGVKRRKPNSSGWSRKKWARNMVPKKHYLEEQIQALLSEKTINLEDLINIFSSYFPVILYICVFSCVEYIPKEKLSSCLSPVFILLNFKVFWCREVKKQ